jgi:CheY-like chemotaxis protein
LPEKASALIEVVMARILVIDDDPNFLEFTRIVLESDDHKVFTADDVSEGLEKMRQVKPDVVILDVMISYCMDGFNATKKMREDPELRDISLILVSAIVDREEVASHPKQECVYDCFMSKPIAPGELLGTVKKLL